jgi:dipeptidyl aminopeptidase/acylaminoacyl peptidase
MEGAENHNIKHIAIVFLLIFLVLFTLPNKQIDNEIQKEIAVNDNFAKVSQVKTESDYSDHPLSVTKMRNDKYYGSDLSIEKKLDSDGNYDKYIASYLSENLKIYGLLTIPRGIKPSSGWPTIVFNHGYIRPNQYRTTGYYIPYIRSLSNAGYIVFMPDYRGHDKSDGEPDSQYFSPSYTIDALNAMYSLRGFKDVNPERIGMWGHSDGGNVIMRAITARPNDIKVAVIWGGVMAPYKELTSNWQLKVAYQQPEYDLKIENKNRDELLAEYGSPSVNIKFWSAIDPLEFLSETNTPIQLHAGEKDEEVPIEYSQNLHDKLLSLNKISEFYIYPNGDHNIINPNYHLAMQRTIEFFDRYLK